MLDIDKSLAGKKHR
jgi:hypothetical protein